MLVRFVLTLGRRSLEEFFDDNCTQLAAAISYYVLLSLFPLLIFLVGILGFFLQNSQLQRDIINNVLDFIPLSEDKGRDQVTEAVKGVAGVGSGALGLFGLLGMAWSASSMFGIIRSSLNKAYDLDYRRPLVQQKLLDLAMVPALGLFFLASIAATGFLRVVRQRSGDIPHLGEFADKAGLLWDAASFLLPLALSFAAFMLLYWLVPAARIRPRDVWPGAFVAAVLFEIAKIGFSIYLEHFSSYDLVYGSLGAVATFLVWIYIGANIMLLGAEVAAEYPRVLRGDYPQPPPGPRRPLMETIRAKVRGLFVLDRDDEETPGP